MNLAEQMRATSNKVTNRKEMELLFNELVLPRIKRVAENKGNEASFSEFNSHDVDKRVKQVFPNIGSLQRLIETEMRPYIEEQGFEVVVCSPSYYVYIRW